MNKCSVVIGSLWGDEGKGHMTSRLCGKDTLNVRFNGGAQASHTAISKDGKRHAFSHFGSGSFNGARTYLTEDFIVNPIAFCMELSELQKKFVLSPTVFVNPDAIVTTPWDIYINQAIETIRDENRHGSCGLGINETVVRSQILDFKLTVKDLFSHATLQKKFSAIRNEYVPKRLREEYNLDVSDLPEEFQEAFKDQTNWEMFSFFVRDFLSYTIIRDDSIFSRFNDVVFEGAQGLLLDQNNTEFFPHVTTSNTGIQNVLKTLSSVAYQGNMDIYYMSRCYLTRHGAGPFPREVLGKPYVRVYDPTNVHNKFQGYIRFGYLDFDLLASAINKDLLHLKNVSIPHTVNVAFTCLDQIVDDTFSYYYQKVLKSFSNISLHAFHKLAQSILGHELKKLDNIHMLTYLERECFGY